MENCDKTKSKLPMFYDQVNSLMKVMAKCYLVEAGFRYFNSFKQLYSRVRSDLSKDRQQHYDNEIRKLEDTFGINGLKKDEFDVCPAEKIRLFKKRDWLILSSAYELEIKLFQDLEEAGIFKVLKQDIEKMELG